MIYFLKAEQYSNVFKKTIEGQSKTQKRLARSVNVDVKTKAAIRLLTDDTKGGVLRLSDKVDSHNTIRDVLISEHPPHQTIHPDSTVTNDDPPEVHPELFESIDAPMKRSAALRTTAAAGPSELDAPCWKRLYLF